jgi:hypothetical protein
MKEKKFYEYIGENSKRLTITINFNNSTDRLIMECLDVYCNENSMSYSSSIKEMMKTYIENKYGVDRHKIQNIKYN